MFPGGKVSVQSGLVGIMLVGAVLGLIVAAMFTILPPYSQAADGIYLLYR